MPETGDTLKILLTTAWLLPLAGFFIEIYWLIWSHRLSKGAAVWASGFIAAGFVCSLIAFSVWADATGWSSMHDGQHHVAEPAAEKAFEKTNVATGHPAKSYSGTYYELARFGQLTISLDWYIDSLTLVMFMMVTFIATCIHLFAIGYMQEELTEEYEDDQINLRDGGQFSRPGRFHSFFAYLSLFCFSMLGLLLAGNLFQVFIFWELVGICSYLLIGFYYERKSACLAANKAFIMNRVGDFGFLIGLMVIWTGFGTFQFADSGPAVDASAGLFTMIRGHDGKLDVSSDGKTVYLHDVDGHRSAINGKPRTMSYLLLVAAGFGVFAGCVGKSAQFPLQTWLPDAMEGPTPVSALVHSATMVAAGVYLMGRFYPMFTPEVLLGIAYTGCLTLFIGATIATVVTDIKQVLAYSTISQLGYMTLAIGVGGWAAALFHLVTHAFFKSLMFLCAGSVIAGCHHVHDIRRMGGLRRKMKVTAFTMLIGVIALTGLAIPGTSIGFSGFFSKDGIIASALAYSELNPGHFLLFMIPLVTAGISAFSMFRLWFLTFAGTPRDPSLYEQCHESPSIMTIPLIVLALIAAGCAWGDERGPLHRAIANSEVVPSFERAASTTAIPLVIPGQRDVHRVRSMATSQALIAAFLGLGLAWLLYVQQTVNPADLVRQFSSLHNFLLDKWRFDALYDVMFVQPVHVVSIWCVHFDRNVLDRILHSATYLTVLISKWDRKFDETMIDGIVNYVGSATFSLGSSLKAVQTGHLRQYVMWIGVAVAVLFGALFIAIPN